MLTSGDLSLSLTILFVVIWLQQQVIGSILDPLRVEFEQVVPRTGEDDEAWHSLFESFLTALAERRKQRYRNHVFLAVVQFETVIKL